MDGVRVVLLDIEGTTTPIAFVHDVLFPFARARVRRFLLDHAGEARLAPTLDGLRPEPDAGLDRVVAHVHALMDRDAKLTPLKTLQGLIWEEGYRSGELEGDVFPDVPDAFARWRAAGRRVAIFSSGSVLAQRLLFGHTAAGDLTGAIDAFFDTTAGSKKAAASYLAIARRLGVPPAEILFVSDVVEELDAAAGAGLQVALAERPGNAPPRPGHPYRRVADFGAIRFRGGG